MLSAETLRKEGGLKHRGAVEALELPQGGFIKNMSDIHFS